MGNNVCPVNVPAREFFRGKKNAKAAQKKKPPARRKEENSPAAVRKGKEENLTDLVGLGRKKITGNSLGGVGRNRTDS